MKKNFYHKIGVAELLAEVVKQPEKERGEWILSLALDLISDDESQAKTSFAKDLITRTNEGREAASKRNKENIAKRWASKNSNLDTTRIPNDTTLLSSSSRSSKRSKPIYTEDFLFFWESYPNKTGKGKAFDSWIKMGCEKLNGEILAAVDWQKKTDQWSKDKGQFIPHPATWLNQKRWEDEPTQETSTGTDYGQY